MAIGVSQAFKDAMQAPVKVIQATIVADEQTFTSADYLTNLSIEASGYYFGTTTKALEFNLLGTTYDLLNKAINVSISVQTDAANDTWEHCNLGNFYVYEQEVKMEREITTFKAYDKVGMMAKEYYTSGGFTFPCTVSNLVEQFESKFGLHFTPETLVNGNYQITEDLYAKINNITYRDILAELAGATASIVNIGGVGNIMTFRETPRTAIETWTYDNLKSIKLEPKYGTINAVTLSRAPEEDNISAIDEPVVQDEGTELEFKDVSRFKSVTLEGETSQRTYTGKNLFLAPTTPTNTWQLSYTKNSDNSFTVTKNEGVTSGVAYVEIAINGLLPNTQYTISFKPSTSPIRFRTRTNGTWHDMITSDGSGVTFTSGSSTTNVAFYNYQNGDGYLISPMTISDVQIELGSTATAYEPYVGGIASPNPDYPQAVQTVTGRQVVGIYGKNLWDSEMVIGGIGSAGSPLNRNDRFSSATKIKVLPNTTYTFSAISKTTGKTLNVVFQEYDSNGTIIGQNPGNYFSVPPLTITTSANCEYLTLSGRYSDDTVLGTVGDYTDAIQNIQLELGSSATDYEPYNHQEYEVNLGKNLWNPTPYKTGSVIAANGQDYHLSNGVQWEYKSVLPSAEYTFSITGGAQSGNMRIHAFDNNGTWIQQIDVVPIQPGISATKTITTPANIGILRWSFYNDSTSNQLELGSTATSYAPYISHFGKNLFDKNSANITLDKWLGSDGTETTGSDWEISEYIPIVGGMTYTTSSAGGDFGGLPARCYYTADKTFISGVQHGWASPFTNTAPSNAVYMRETIRKTSTSVQIEQGSVATSYEPCIAGPIKLSKATKSGSTFRDKIFRNSDKWYVHKEFGNITFRETDIALSSQSYTNVVYARIEKTKDTSSYGNYSDNYPLVCTHAIHGRVSSPSGWDTSDNIGRISNNATTAHWWIGFPIGTTQETARSLLTGAELYYTLKTATDAEITNPDLIAQLNAVLEAELPSETNFVTSSGDLTTYLDIEAYKKVDVKEIKLANNEILDDNREATILPILNSVSGFEFYPFEATTEGHGWHECGDRIAVTDGTNTWDVVISYIKLTIDGGIKETIKGVRPTESQTNYALAGGIMKTIYNTEIKVDKQGQEITSIVSRQDSFENQTLDNFSQVVQNINSVTTTIQTTGGGNLLHNSVGYNVNTDKTLKNWTQSGNISSESSPESVSYGAISGNQIDFGASSSITQRITVDNSGNQLYTLGFKVKKSATGVVTVHLRNNIDDYTVSIPEGSAILWKGYSIVGVAPHASYFDVVIETNNAVSSLAITDMMLSVGDTTIPWVSASDEILSKNVAVDSSGVTVRSSATNDYTQLNELGLNGYSDASGSMENVFTVNRDTTEVSKLKARKQISMPPIKIVPVTSGSRAGWGFVKGE